MTSAPASELERAVAAFRREHAIAYLKRLAGQQREPELDGRARASLLSERGLSLLEASRAGGELDDDHYAALCAHFARAALERRYQPARDAQHTLLRREVSVEGDTRTLGALLGVWTASPTALARARSARAMAPALEVMAGDLLRARERADRALSELFDRLRPPRHRDAGPEGGAGPAAEQWLAQTEELAREAVSFAKRTLGAEGPSGSDALWAALGQDFHGLFPREGRFRRLAADWEPLGLRQLLAARARAAPDHPGPFAGAHVVILAAPYDVRVSASEREYGLASELATAESIGRALGHVHGSPSLPIGLRFASAGTVARAAGSLAVQRFLEPRFLRRVRNLSARESEAVARVAAAYFLLDSRLAAASALARKLVERAASEQAAALAERALLGPVEPGVACALLLRAVPGSALRGKLYGPALSWALRERYDEDWYLNPRASEPLRGAFARAGAFSVEQFAEELATELGRGIQKLSELF